MTSVLPPKRRFQNPWLNTTTVGAAASSSATRVVRPASAGVASTSKKLPDTMIDLTRSASPPPVMFIGHEEYAASVTTAAASFAWSRQSAAESGSGLPFALSVDTTMS
jgi:hypothetical protein